MAKERVTNKANNPQTLKTPTKFDLAFMQE